METADEVGAEGGVRPMVLADVRASAGDPARRWEPFREGIEISRLYTNPGGPSAAFLRYAPGASLERHEHTGYEHIFVLSGAQRDESGEHSAGAVVIHPPGTSHAVESREGCVVLALWEKPAVFGPAAAGRRRPASRLARRKT